MESFKRNGTDRRVILLMGPPGSGKGTQGAMLARRLQLPVISTGEMLRKECEAGTELGKLVRSILDSGGLVGDDLMNRLVSGRLCQSDCRRGFALDGYPRTAAQAQFLDQLLDGLGLPRPTVLHLEVARETILLRLTARRQCASCGKVYNLLHQPPRRPGACDEDGGELISRSDDTASVVSQRLKAYDRTAAPLIRYYRDRNYHRINGDRPLEAVLEDLSRILLPAPAVLQAS